MRLRGYLLRISRRRLILIGAAVLMAVPLLALATRWLANRLSAQVWYLVWRADLALDSVPQAVFWVLLVVIAVVLATVSLIQGRRPGPGQRESRRSGLRPVRELATLIERAVDGYYFKWILAQKLSSLLVEAVDGPRLGPAGMRREWYLRDKPGVPAEIQAYVKAAIWEPFLTRSNLASLWKRARSRQQPSTAFDLDLTAVIQFIEAQLEVVDV
jgi:hypothetical protein